MQAGLLDEVIDIERLEYNIDEYGSQKTERYVKAFSTRARVIYENGGVVLDNSELFFANRTKFEVRYYHNISNLDRIVWRGDKYRITNIERSRKLQKQIISTELINN